MCNNASSNLDLIGLFHIGDVPGRHEPGTGEINYRTIFKFLDNSGYDGYVSLEFVPTIDPAETVRQTKSLAVADTYNHLSLSTRTHTSI